MIFVDSDWEKNQTEEDLKTLKDIKFSSHIEEDLRQLAIKWIKELRNHKFYCVACEKFDCDCGSSDFFKPRSEGVESWIKHNFNIIEEDLKNART